jgi:hypothetical protein
MLSRCDRDVGYRRHVLELCRADTLLFYATFCWLYEPRPTPKVIPFIPWPHQVPAIQKLDECWGKRDCIFDKSRGEGATWIVLLRMLKSWLFEPLFAGGLASRNIQAVDRRDDMDALMPKLDWELTMLPEWMVPDYRRVYGDEHILVNNENRATIAGYAATDDLGSGGRKTAWVWDEPAKFPAGRDQAALDSTEATTECRVMISTFKGTNNAYYRLTRDPGNTPVIVLDWKDNPTRNRGMFRIVDGRPVAVDEKRYGCVPQDFLDRWDQLSEQLNARGYRLS